MYGAFNPSISTTILLIGGLAIAKFAKIAKKSHKGVFANLGSFLQSFFPVSQIISVIKEKSTHDS